MPQPSAIPQKGLQLEKKNGLKPSPKKPAVPRNGTIGRIGPIGPIGLIGNRRGGRDGKKMPEEVSGRRNGVTGLRKEFRGVMPAGRVMMGRVITGVAAVGRLTPAAGARTTGACGARNTPGLAPPAWAPAAPAWAPTAPR